MKGFFGEIMDENERDENKKYMNDTLVTFLTSSLNVELVHVILKSITSHCKSEVMPGAKYLDYEKSDFKEKHEFTLDSVKIKDPDSWKVAKLPDFLNDDYKRRPTNNTLTSKDAPKTRLDQMFEDDNLLIINEDVKIIEYAPKIFAFLRKLDDISQKDVKDSLSAKKNRDMVFKAGESQGKSGSFFFFSHDRKFLIKTMTNSDKDAFFKIFTDYMESVSCRPNCLLARIYGVFTVQMEDIEPVHLILMGNSKMTKTDKAIEHVFDLKGSFIHREVSMKKAKNTTTLKDVNLLNLKMGKIFLRFSKED